MRRDARGFLIFSGHNPRAVLALCRYFTRAEVPFFLVVSAGDDPILGTRYRERVLYRRTDDVVDLRLFREAVRSSGRDLVYCPTTEFINVFALQNRAMIESGGVHVPLPSSSVYGRVTGKRTSQELFSRARVASVPREFAIGDPTFPCVLKPRVNIHQDRALYPIICRDETDLLQALEDTDIELYFAQRYVQGESLYLCGHIARDGSARSFWQHNLLQQPGGKSMVLALEDTRRHGGVGRTACDALREAGYFGPFMIEYIKANGRYHYIETNPRFWGPLQLTLDALPEALDAFCRDCAFEPKSVPRHRVRPAAYSWLDGMLGGELRHHSHGYSAHRVAAMSHEWDVFSRSEYDDRIPTTEYGIFEHAV